MADEAAKRREARRRKILENSEDRMKRLLGQHVQEDPETQTQSQTQSQTDNAQGSDSGSSSSSVVRKLEDALLDDAGRRSSQDDNTSSDAEIVPKAPSEEETMTESFETLSSEESERVYRRSPIRANTPQEAQSGVPKSSSSSLAESTDGSTITQELQAGFQKSRSSSPVDQTGDHESRPDVQSGFQKSRSSSPVDGSASADQQQRLEQQRAFQRVRQLLCVAVGCLVRLAFLHWLGEAVIMSALVPFVAFELGVVAYQKSCCMDLGADVKGGLWLSTLVLSGVKPEVIETYKHVMGAMAAAMDDLTVFFFSFVITHLVTPIT